VLHIPQFGDATTSSAGDLDVSAGDVHLQISGCDTTLFVSYILILASSIAQFDKLIRVL